MRVVSAHDLTRVRLCVEPGCPQEAEVGSTRCREHIAELAAAPERRTLPWTRQEAIRALQTRALAIGRCPTSTESRDQKDVPSAPTYTKLFGNWGNYCVAAGFDRPTRGGGKKRPVLEEVASSNLGPADAASSSKRALGTAGTRSGEAEAPAAPNARTARLRVIQRIAAVREEIDAMERELLDALQDEAA